MGARQRGEVRRAQAHSTRANPIQQASHPGIHRPNTVFSRECWHVYCPAGSALQPESTDQYFQVGSPPKPEQ